MNVAGCQRWRARRHSYRPAGECIATAEYEVAAVAEDRVARAFVEAHHYSATYPAARFRFGLYRRGALVGVSVFSHPCSDAVLTRVFPGEARASVELGRFVLLDNVPGNGETWFLARCFEHLRRESLTGVVSFSDPVARATAAGATIFPGHVGTIYQAANAVYLGRGRGGVLRLLPNGTVLSARAVSKLRSGERGFGYVSALVQAHGAPPPPSDPLARVAWANAVVAQVTRPLRHPGNHKYAWPLDRAARRLLPPSAAYPKLLAA